MARTMTVRMKFILVAALVLGAIGCGGNTTVMETAVSVKLSPSSAIVGPGQTFQFSGTLSGGTSNAAIWSVNGVAGGTPAAGTISPSGLYTSPSSGPSQVVTVTVTSAADTSKSASATVTVVAAGAVSNTANPQVADYQISVPRDATVSVEFGPDTTYGKSTWAVSAPAGGGEVDLLVAGMKAFSTYHMRADIQFSDGTSFMDSDHTFETGGLTSDRIPPITVTTPTSGLTPQSGLELVDLAATPGSQLRMMAVDLQGNIVWFYDFDTLGGALSAQPKPLPDGNMAVLVSGSPQAPAPPDQNVIEEVDLAGNVTRQVSLTQINQELAAAGFNLVGQQMHHDFIILPNGHRIVLVNDYRDFTDLTGYPGVTHVLGDAIVDLDQNDQPVWVWNAFDHLDVNRHPFQFPDWTHSNGLAYSPDDGNLILSMRHQNWVIKIDYEDGKGNGDVLWRLGSEGDFTLTTGGESDWFYNQHAPVFLSPNTTGVFQLGLFDNGNQRPDPTTGLPCQTSTGAPGGGACFSRAPILQIDENARTAAVMFENQAPDFGFCCGYMETLSNGDTEYDLATSTQAPPWDAHVRESTSASNPQVVWDMEFAGSLAYRAFRIPSLYPGVQW